MGESTKAKGRLAVIKFFATIVCALCTLCTEKEMPMTKNYNPTEVNIETLQVDNTADRPSA